MSDSASSPKRRRTESKATTPVRSKTWMSTGNVILQAESTQFRVHSDILSRQSPVFQDMFSVPQPANEPTVEGCPVVQVSDSAQDWEVLLGALYDPFKLGEALPFALVAAMLRLGRKYEMSAATNNALLRIHYEYPRTLDAWLDVAGTFTKIDYSNGIIVDCLKLIVECGIATSIPTAAYSCLDTLQLACDICFILNVVKNHFPQDRLMNDEVPRHDGSAIVLRTQTKLMLATAADRIHRYQKTSWEWLDDESVIPDAKCRTRSKCSERRRQIYRTVSWGAERRYYLLAEWDDDEGWTSGLCSSCNSAGCEAFVFQRLQAWNLLPGFFDLPNWGNLKDDD